MLYGVVAVDLLRLLCSVLLRYYSALMLSNTVD